MPHAITTRYFGPTDVTGARIRARADTTTLTVPYDHAMNRENNHRAAAELLATNLGWCCGWRAGDTLTGYTFLPIEEPALEQQVRAALAEIVAHDDHLNAPGGDDNASRPPEGDDYNEVFQILQRHLGHLFPKA